MDKIKEACSHIGLGCLGPHARGPSLQGVAYSLLHDGLRREPLAPLVLKRLRRLLPALAGQLDLEHCSSLLACLRKHRPHVAMCTLKTLSNGWTTSHRMHETPQLPCVFGCPDVRDTLAHYFECPHLWVLVGRALRVHVPGTVAQRLGMPQITTQTVHSMFLAFHMHHAAKVGHRGVVLTAMATSDFASSHQVALSSSRAALTLLGQGL